MRYSRPADRSDNFNSWSLQVGARHSGSYYLEPTNQHEYDGHDLLNFRLKQQLSKTVSGVVRINILLDEDYAERVDYGFGEYRYFIGERRAVFVELSLTL